MQPYKLTPLDIALSAVTVVLGIVYTGLFASTASLVVFHQAFADILFLAFILIAIVLKLKQSDSLVDPIYWYLLGGAFFSWFVVSIIKLGVWSELSHNARILITNIGYFLYFSLSIAAIEIKNYHKAVQLLSFQSLIVWLSTLLFALGMFVVLILAATTNLGIQHELFSQSFIYYIFMDLYLAARWLHLAISSKNNNSNWESYLYLGIGTFLWGIADCIEGLQFAHFIQLESGSFTDWVWYLPYLFIFIGVQKEIPSQRLFKDDWDINRIHLFNSPLFFAILSLLLLRILTEEDATFAPLSLTQLEMFYSWIGLLCILSLVHLSELLKQLKSRQRELQDAEFNSELMLKQTKQQARDLLAQASANKAILDTTQNAILTLTSEGEILSCNPACERLLAISNDKLLNSNITQYLAPEEELNRYFSYQSYRQKLVQQNQGIELETQILSQDNHQIAVHVTLSRDNSPTADGLLVLSMVDISEQKLAEQTAHQLKDQFTANISHEFRTPLTIINGVLDKLLADPAYLKDNDRLKSAKRNSLRMIRMVEQLLDLSQIASEALPMSVLDLQNTAKFICSSFTEIAQANGIEYQCHLDQPIIVNGNQKAFEKILFNLLSNAFKYTREGKISVTLNCSDKQYSLIVKDSGIGIPENKLEDIFKRFHREENQFVQSVQGVGIGLSLVKELCDAMDWKLSVSSQVNYGSEFKLILRQANEQPIPIEKDNSHQANNQLSDSQLDIKNNNLKGTPSSNNKLFSDLELGYQLVDSRSSNVTPTKKSKYSVLIVEDNLDMQAHIKEILAPHHQCLLADNGEEGLKVAFDYLPDIIISDVMMPKMDGFQLLKSIKSRELTTHIPVILLTARNDAQSKITGLESEADDYISKPFQAEELRLRIKNQLNSRLKLQKKLSQQWQTTGISEEPVVIEDKFLSKLDGIFQENYQDSDFSMQSLALKLAMSERQVQRKIKSVLGVSPLEALKKFRLKKAKASIENGEQIGAVSQTCGFSSQSYFGRCFKEEFGMPPKKFQQSLQ
ncbi:response regulator [Aliikangiella sp. IMCC44653]